MASDINSNGVLTRKEKEELVLDLYFNQNKTYSEIAKIAKISPRDIKPIIDKAIKEKERMQHKSTAVQAYELFFKGKTLLQVTIDLNLNHAQATEYYGEYLKLVGLDNIAKIYQELQGAVWYFVKLCKEAKAAKIGVLQVINLLRIANNYLPSVEHRSNELQKEIGILDSILATKGEEFQSLSNNITDMSKRLDIIKSECEKENSLLYDLRYQATKLQAFVNNYKNNDPEYTKLKKIINEEILEILSDNRALLKLAVLSIAESIRNNPDKYSPLVSNHSDDIYPPSMTTATYDSRTDDSSCHMCQPPQQLLEQQSYLPQNNYIGMLIDEAHKLYTFLAERFFCDIVNENVSKQSIPATTLPATELPLEEEGVEYDKEN
jgi:hypothetical protein